MFKLRAQSLAPSSRGRSRESQQRSRVREYKKGTTGLGRRVSCGEGEHMLTLLGLGLLLGLRHAFELDHAAAVAASASRRTSVRVTLRQRVAWGIGHSLTLSYLGFGTLVTLLALNSVPASAEWGAVEADSFMPGQQTVYTDRSTLQREGNLVTMWQLIDFKWMQGGQSPTRFLSTETAKQFDCALPRLRLLAFSEFSCRMGTGIRNDGFVDTDNWLSITPGSMNQGLWEGACLKR